MDNQPTYEIRVEAEELNAILQRHGDDPARLQAFADLRHDKAHAAGAAPGSVVHVVMGESTAREATRLLRAAGTPLVPPPSPLERVAREGGLLAAVAAVAIVGKRVAERLTLPISRRRILAGGAAAVAVAGAAVVPAAEPAGASCPCTYAYWWCQPDPWNTGQTGATVWEYDHYAGYGCYPSFCCKGYCNATFAVKCDGYCRCTATTGCQC